MWRVLRGLYLLAWWAAVVLGAVAAFWAWKIAPGAWLGVRWYWFVAAGLVGLGVVALGVTLDLPMHALPPEASPAEEVRRWAVALFVGFLTAALFAVLVGVPMVLSHFILTVVARWLDGMAAVLVFALWVGWPMGVFMALSWLSDQPLVQRLRRGVVGWNASSPADIAALVEAAPLPQEEKARWLEHLALQGLTPALAQEMLDAITPRLEQATHTRERTRYAVLFQALSDWLEAHPQEDLSTSAFSQ